MARKKQTYEEQRMDELLYAEEYRRRLRMEREAENSESVTTDSIPMADVPEDDGELDLIRRDRDERRRRNDDILSRVTKIYTVPGDTAEGVTPISEEHFAVLDNEGAIELVGEADDEPKTASEEWAPITKEPLPAAASNSVRIEIGASSISHTLHIEGVEIQGVSAGYTATVADAPLGDIDYVGIERKKRGGSVIHTSDSFNRYTYADDTDAKGEKIEPEAAPRVETDSPVTDADIGGGVIFSEGYADSSALDDMQSFIYAPVTRCDRIAADRSISESAYTAEDEAHYTERSDRDRDISKYESLDDRNEQAEDRSHTPSAKSSLNDGTEEEDLLAFIKYNESRNREIAKGGAGKGGDPHSTHTTRDTTANGYSEADINGKSRMTDKEDREHKRLGSSSERREMEADMERLLREDAEFKRNTDKKEKDGVISDQPNVHPFDKKALKKEEKVQCDRDIAFIEARINSHLDKLEHEKDASELTFTENTKADRRESAKREHEIKDTKKKLRDAVYFERQDNKRYYSFVMMDLIHERLPKDADLKLLVSLREKLISLLHQRDTVNKRLTELYLGQDGGKKSASRERDKAARSAMRAEFNRQKKLNNKIKSAHLEKSFADMLRELMDEQVRLAGELAECRHILRRERPKGQAAKDVKAREKRADADYKKNKREIDRISKKAFRKASVRKHKSNSAVLGWIGLLAIAIIGVVVWLNWDALLQYIGEILPGLIGGLIPSA